MKRGRAAAAMLAACVIFLGATGASGWTSRQSTAHEIAELARGMGLQEDDPIIVRASEIWWEDNFLREGAKIPQSATPTAPSEREPDLWSGVLPYSVSYNSATEAEAVMIAKVIFSEARGIWSQTEQACVAWTICNRVDAGMAGSVYAAITAPYQFAYRNSAPTVDDYGRDLTALARDVIFRWRLERAGQSDVGRVLPKGYCWYSGDGRHNYFRNTYGGQGAIWFGLSSPYGS